MWLVERSWTVRHGEEQVGILVTLQGALVVGICDESALQKERKEKAGERGQFPNEKPPRPPLSSLTPPSPHEPPGPQLGCMLQYSVQYIRNTSNPHLELSLPSGAPSAAHPSRTSSPDTITISLVPCFPGTVPIAIFPHRHAAHISAP